MKSVAIIGSAVVDIYLIDMPEWPSKPGMRTLAPECEYHPGGNGLNVARHLSMLGAANPISLYTATSQRSKGHGELVKRACQYVVPTQRARPLRPAITLVMPDVPLDRGSGDHTAFSIIKVDAKREPTFACYTGATYLVDLEFLMSNIEDIAGNDAILITSILTLPGLGIERIKKFLNRLEIHCERQNINAPVVFADVNQIDATGGPHRDLGHHNFCKLLQHVDYFLPNEDELLQCACADNETDAIAKLLDYVRRGLVIKRGSLGATMYAKIDNAQEPAPPLRRCIECAAATGERVVDAVGAGDAFVGGFMARILNAPDMSMAGLGTSDVDTYREAIVNIYKDAIRVGCAVAAHAISQRGATGKTWPFPDYMAWLAKVGQKGYKGPKIK